MERTRTHEDPILRFLWFKKLSVNKKPPYAINEVAIIRALVKLDHERGKTFFDRADNDEVKL